MHSRTVRGFLDYQKIYSKQDIAFPTPTHPPFLTSTRASPHTMRSPPLPLPSPLFPCCEEMVGTMMQQRPSAAIPADAPEAVARCRDVSRAADAAGRQAILEGAFFKDPAVAGTVDVKWCGRMLVALSPSYVLKLFEQKIVAVTCGTLLVFDAASRELNAAVPLDCIDRSAALLPFDNDSYAEEPPPRPADALPPLHLHLRARHSVCDLVVEVSTAAAADDATPSFLPILRDVSARLHPHGTGISTPPPSLPPNTAITTRPPPPSASGTGPPAPKAHHTHNMSAPGSTTTLPSSNPASLFGASKFGRKQSATPSAVGAADTTPRPSPTGSSPVFPALGRKPSDGGGGSLRASIRSRTELGSPFAPGTPSLAAGSDRHASFSSRHAGAVAATPADDAASGGTAAGPALARRSSARSHASQVSAASQLPPSAAPESLAPRTPLSPAAGVPATASVRSRTSTVGGGGGVPRLGSHASLASRGSQAQTRLSRHGSVVSVVSIPHSERSGVPLPVEPTTPASAAAAAPRSEIGDAVSVASSARRASELGAAAAPAEEKLAGENEKLRSQVEALQRLLADKSGDAKVAGLQKELSLKVNLIGKLEKDKRTLKKEVKLMRESPKGAGRGFVRVMSPATSNGEGSASSQVGMMRGIDIANVADTSAMSLLNDASNPALAALAAAALQQQQQQQQPRNDGHVAELEGNVSELKKALAEREVQLQQQNLKLDKAQDAIIAGVNWEAPIKLEETRKALRTLMRSCSPVASRQRSHSFDAPLVSHPSTSSVSSTLGARKPLRHGSAAVRSATSLGATGAALPRRESIRTPSAEPTFVSFSDRDGRRVRYSSTRFGVVKTVNGFSSPPLGTLQHTPADASLRDQTGITYLAAESHVPELLGTLAALATASGCKHNIVPAAAAAAASPQQASPSPLQHSSGVKTPLSTPSRAVVAAHWLVDDGLPSQPRSMSPNRHAAPSLPAYLSGSSRF